MRKILLLILLLPIIANAITPIFCCGFECGSLGTNGQHFANTSNASIVTIPARSGSRSLRLLQGSSASAQASTLTLSSGNIWVFRIYIYIASLPNGTTFLIGSPLVGGNRIGVAFRSSDQTIVTAAGGAFGTTGFSVTTGQWYSVDCRINISANPWVVDAQVNGTTISQRTAALAASNFNSLLIGHGAFETSTTDIDFDDLIVSQTTGDYPIGGGYVNHFIPNSDGTHNIAGTGDFAHGTAGSDIVNATTDANTLVRDVPLPSSITTSDLISLVAPPNATDYVECVFGPASGISTPTAGPRAVEVIIAYHQAGTGAGNMEVRLNDNGTTGVIYTATGVLGVTTLAYARANFADPPSAASVWTVVSGNGNFNNVRMRFGSPAAVDANPDQYLDAIMIEAEFAEVALTVPGAPSDKRHTTLGVGSVALNKQLKQKLRVL